MMRWGVPAAARASRAVLSRRALASRAEQPVKPFDKILIANRGEIASRVALTARRLGIRSVAVFSDADRNARHVALADEAFHVGAAPAAQSYLRADALLDVARRTGAQAVHPGYGFLSENAGFARACADAGVTFIGPPAAAIEAMGSKSASKRIMTDAGVPCVPGYHGEDQSLERFAQEADKCKYPVLIKAIMGGGGKGMRIVHSRKELEEGMKSAAQEAQASFGDGTLLIEKYVERPRHIEFQVFADTHGNVVHLFERDCSMQRRYQKVIEEAPAPGMSPELRKRMGDAAVAAARAVGYVGAGTVEFILDAATQDFYFMEMNTRLQVEHPVTELITRQDLVEWQLRVAAGGTLPMAQDDLAIHGHALEARIYAENPRAGFLPHTGHLAHLKPPAESANVRVDTGVRQGDDVSVYYDPMIAKLIVHDADRTSALRRLDTALADYQIAGLPSNIEFLRRATTHPAFEAGEIETSFIPTYRDDLLPPLPPAPRAVVGAAAAFQAVIEAGELGAPLRAARFGVERVRTVRLGDRSAADAPDKDADGVRAWRSIKVREPTPVRRATMAAGDGVQPLAVFSLAFDDPEAAAADSEWTEAQLIRVERLDGGGAKMRLQLADQRFDVTAVPHADELHIFYDGHKFEFLRKPADIGTADEVGGVGTLKAPMPGKVVEVLRAAGDKVQKGDAVLVVEAMKMQHTIKSPIDGVIESVNCKPDQLIDEKVTLATVTAEGE